MSTTRTPRLSNPQWRVLKAVVDLNHHGNDIYRFTQADGRTVAAMVRGGALTHVAGDRYRLTPEGLKALRATEDRHERQDRG